MRFEMYQDDSAKHEWRWRLWSANNRIIANSGEGYHNEQDCRHAIDLIRGTINVPVVVTRR